MFYYIPEWIKWWNKKRNTPIPQDQEDALGEIIRRRAVEQNAVIDRKEEKKDIELLPSPTE